MFGHGHRGYVSSADETSRSPAFPEHHEVGVSCSPSVPKNEPAGQDRRRLELGRRGEEIARRRLESTGYTVLETNVWTPAGEIDLVSEKDGALVFVEVRTRASRSFSPPRSR